MVRLLPAKANWFWVVLISGLVFISWWPTRHLPYHWDTPGFIINGARYLDQTNFETLIVQHGNDFAHPPLFHVLLALSWRILGDSFLVSHLVSGFFFYLLVLSGYFIGSTVHSRLAGLFTAVWLLLTPYLLAEMGLVYLDLAVGALFSLGLLFWLKHRVYLAIFIFSLAILTKLTILPGLIVILLVTFRFNPHPAYPKAKLYSLVFPLGLAGLWLIYHFTHTGWWLVLPGRDTVSPRNLAELVNSAKFVFYVFFIHQNRWLLSLLTLISSITTLKRHPPLILNYYFLILGSTLTLVGLGAFAMSGEYIPRYSIYLVPAFYALCVSLILTAFPKTISYLALMAIALSFALTLHPRLTPSPTFQFRVNEDLSYLDMIKVGQTAAKYLETNFPNSPIVGSFPQTYQLTEAYQGYVTAPLNFHPCDSSAIYNLRSMILYLQPNHFSQIACQELLRQTQAQPLTTFTQNGQWAALYLIEAQ